MGLLETIQGPEDLKALPAERLPALAAEVRDFLVAAVSRTGGHLGPNLGVVELTIGLHRVFDSPRDRLVFDTGHQSYVHKLLTGRQDFSRLREAGGLSGYPARAESEHDVVENSHASTSLSWADGLAKAFELRGETDRRVVAVIGDGALTGGMAWEALNNIAAANRPVIVVVNDNERSYAPTIGGMASHLATLRTTREYEKLMDWGKRSLGRGGVPGRLAYETLHGMKRGIKDIVAPQGLFEDLGLKYVGPVDGHDTDAVEHALRRARSFGGPVIVHVITQKGRGYQPALADDADHFHAVGVIDPETGEAQATSGASWTSVFADEVVEIAATRRDVVGITAAMRIPVGLEKFAQAFPERVFDVGIAEQHALTSAAGMAAGGLHPVVAVYATFLNRAFDQLLLDVALHRAGVTLVLDRAGVTGPDGPSHHGVWDLAMCRLVPGLRLAAPRDAPTLREELREAVAVEDAPTVVRYSKGKVPAPIPAIARVGHADVLEGPAWATGDDVLLVAVGSLVPRALDVAARLRAHGVGVTVVDPRWVVPVDEALVDLALGHRHVAVLEDGCEVGGFGWALAARLRERHCLTPVHVFALPQEFLDVGERGAILDEAGLAPQDVARAIVEAVAQGSGQQVRSSEDPEDAASPTSGVPRSEEFPSR
ncbi:1-deoxy-D-xylulose-5-phosphate synthase [Kineococcus rhizosphaerae]|uniref:1-deoxy-D-xylulose-5-phosphate synthase n=1 Tax=Kineococcus rhizosphaerae TaxID=559628 RepID=A0A2T0RB09_9ACTN|nr:1-deoxy-D-xylulose-5-phosphate synthase [Kineococcus rhizosphaerae]PRY18343.1 1-deoxy-D-xylulose-5-phosphate synthase [Kineococcus rhizosphaerae]